MIRVEIRETIDRPVEDVFERLVDIDRYPSWMPDGGLFLDCAKGSSGPVAVGTTYTDTTRLGTARGEVSAFDRPRRVEFHYVFRLFGLRMMEGWPGYWLEPDGRGGTELHHVAEGYLSGAFALLRPLVQKLAERERGRTVAALKESLETS